MHRGRVGPHQGHIDELYDGPSRTTAWMRWSHGWTAEENRRCTWRRGQTATMERRGWRVFGVGGGEEGSGGSGIALGGDGADRG